MEKYGFVYIWFDRKHKRYYIGCRWGREDDGYICSSPWMKQGYRHRPNDFKRRILSRIYSNKKDLLEEEYRWLSKIGDHELGKRYYNLHNHHFGHWSTDESKRMTTGQKISASPNRANNISVAMKNKKPDDKTIEAVKKALTGRSYEEIHGYEKAQEIKEKKKLNRKRPIWTEEMRRLAGERSRKHMIGKKATDETKMKMSASQKRHYEMREQYEKYI